MHLRILGTRGNIRVSAPGYEKHSGILIDDRLLLDLGKKRYLDYEPRWIFITHFHSNRMALKGSDIPRKTSIYAPEAPPSMPTVQIASRDVLAGPYTVTPVPTVHSQRVKSAGYIVQKGPHRVFCSSDMIRIKPEYYRCLGELDLVITEGSFIRSNGLIRVEAQTGMPFGHNGIPKLVEFFSQFTRHIIITHFGTWFFNDIARSRRKIESFSNDVHVMAAYDGMDVDIRQLEAKGRAIASVGAKGL